MQGVDVNDRLAISGKEGELSGREVGGVSSRRGTSRKGTISK
jgi:hypothetical protein